MPTAMALHKLCHSGVRGIVHLHYHTRRSFRCIRCKLAVAPLHKLLRHKDGVKTRGETYHLTLKTTVATCSMNEDAEIYHTYKAFANLRKRMALGEAEVIHGEVRAREDNGDNVRTFLITPLVKRNVNETVWYAFYEQLRIEHIYAFYAHRCLHSISGRYKASGAFNERLRL